MVLQVRSQTGTGALANLSSIPEDILLQLLSGNLSGTNLNITFHPGAIVIEDLIPCCPHPYPWVFSSITGVGGGFPIESDT